jgi:hypothetical protein
MLLRGQSINTLKPLTQLTPLRFIVATYFDSNGSLSGYYLDQLVSKFVVTINSTRVSCVNGFYLFIYLLTDLIKTDQDV